MVVENLESLMILKVLLPLRRSPLESELEKGLEYPSLVQKCQALLGR